MIVKNFAVMVDKFKADRICIQIRSPYKSKIKIAIIIRQYTFPASTLLLPVQNNNRMSTCERGILCVITFQAGGGSYQC